jgi:hypothetical protein
MSQELDTKELPEFTRDGIEGEQEIDSFMADTFKYMSQMSRVQVPKNKEFKRQQVIDAFQHSFELIGGVPRLAAWAHHNPTEFFKLYSKLLPSQSIHDFGGGDGVLRIMHSIAPGPLDTAPAELHDKGRVIEHSHDEPAADENQSTPQ